MVVQWSIAQIEQYFLLTTMFSNVDHSDAITTKSVSDVKSLIYNIMILSTSICI